MCSVSSFSAVSPGVLRVWCAYRRPECSKWHHTAARNKTLRVLHQSIGGLSGCSHSKHRWLCLATSQQRSPGMVRVKRMSAMLRYTRLRRRDPLAQSPKLHLLHHKLWIGRDFEDVRPLALEVSMAPFIYDDTSPSITTDQSPSADWLHRFVDSSTKIFVLHRSRGHYSDPISFR